MGCFAGKTASESESVTLRRTQDRELHESPARPIRLIWQDFPGVTDFIDEARKTQLTFFIHATHVTHMYEEHVEDIVHEGTQSHDAGFDLTVATVHEIVEPGRVDFGGGELEAAGTTPHDSEKRNPNDDYEWWTLRAGQYLLTFNESLTGKATVTVQPRTELLEQGVTHPTIHVRELPKLPITVGGAGIRIKENARVSTIVDGEG